jgi:hypothetical protein
MSTGPVVSGLSTFVAGVMRLERSDYFITMVSSANSFNPIELNRLALKFLILSLKAWFIGCKSGP